MLVHHDKVRRRVMAALQLSGESSVLIEPQRLIAGPLDDGQQDEPQEGRRCGWRRLGCVQCVPIMSAQRRDLAQLRRQCASFRGWLSSPGLIKPHRDKQGHWKPQPVGGWSSACGLGGGWSTACSNGNKTKGSSGQGAAATAVRRRTQGGLIIRGCFDDRSSLSLSPE